MAVLLDGADPQKSFGLTSMCKYHMIWKTHTQLSEAHRDPADTCTADTVHTVEGWVYCEVWHLGYFLKDAQHCSGWKHTSILKAHKKVSFLNTKKCITLIQCLTYRSPKGFITAL